MLGYKNAIHSHVNLNFPLLIIEEGHKCRCWHRLFDLFLWKQYEKNKTKHKPHHKSMLKSNDCCLKLMEEHGLEKTK